MAKKGVISAEQWDTGVSGASDSEKDAAILRELKKVGRGGMNTSGLEEATGIKWLYGPLKRLFEAGVLEKKKVGRDNFFRIAEDQPAQSE